jgi:thioesterase domain-containing protein
MTAEQKAQAEIERARQELEEKAVQAETKATSYFASAEIAKRGLNGFVDVDDFIGRGYSEADIVAKLDARKKAVDDQLAQRIADQNKQAANEFRTAGNGNTQPTKHTIVSKY